MYHSSWERDGILGVFFLALTMLAFGAVLGALFFVLKLLIGGNSVWAGLIVFWFAVALFWLCDRFEWFWSRPPPRASGVDDPNAVDGVINIWGNEIFLLRSFVRIPLL
jgi:hypothetical protein